MTNFIVYDLETDNTDGARRYVFWFSRLSKLAGKHNCDLTPNEMEKFKKGTLVFDWDNCVSNALDFCLKKVMNEKIEKSSSI